MFSEIMVLIGDRNVEVESLDRDAYIAEPACEVGMTMASMPL